MEKSREMTLSVVTGRALIFVLPRVIIALVMEISSLSGYAGARKQEVAGGEGGRCKPALKALQVKGAKATQLNVGR